MAEGQIVVSLRGHDTGRLFLVIRAEGRRVYMVNGQHAFWEKPKKKHVRHVKALTALEKAVWEGLVKEKDKQKCEAMIRKILSTEMARQNELRMEDCSCQRKMSLQ